MLCFILLHKYCSFYKLKARPSTSKRISTCFIAMLIAVVCIQNSNISEVCLCLFNWNYLTTYSIISIVSYLWWFIASCSCSCGWQVDWIKKITMQMETEQYSGTLLPSYLTAYHIFLYAFLLPAAMGSSSLSLNQMSSGFRSHDEKFMESWTHYKFYSFTAEILQVLLTYWRKKYVLFYCDSQMF